MCLSLLREDKRTDKMTTLALRHTLKCAESLKKAMAVGPKCWFKIKI